MPSAWRVHARSTPSSIARVDPDPTFTGLTPRTDDDLHCYTTVFADDQRGVQYELVHPWAPRTVTRV